MVQRKGLSRWSEFGIAGVGLIALLIAEWILTTTIPGTQYSQNDGKMAQVVIRTALKFGGLFQLNNINPLQGIGSQLQPDNVWLNPAYWPFAVFDGPLALDASALIALGCLSLACYLMARCFDVPVLPSMLAAQLSIILFGPLAYLFFFYQVFWINPGIAIVYAPVLLALGVLVRLEPGRMRDFVLATAAIFALLLYGLSCDPLWVMISAIGLAGAFAVVVLSPLRVRPILIRCAALGCCLVLFLLTGVIGYVYTLTQYTARVLFSLASEAEIIGASIVFISPKTAGSYYGLCAVGWLLGLLLARGRVRVLAIVGLVSFATVVVYSTTYLLIHKWWLLLPLYVEHCLFPLFTMAAMAGYWAAGVAAFKVVTGMRQPAVTDLSSRWVERNPHTRAVALAASLPALLVAVFLPAAAMMYGVRASPTLPDLGEPFADEPELMSSLRDSVGLRVDGEFRGSIGMLLNPYDSTIYNLWLQGIPTFNEYSQLVSSQATYFSAALFKYDVSAFDFFFPWFGRTVSYDVLFKAWQALGMRYAIAYSPFDAADQRHFPSVTFPRRPVGAAPANWIVYELPNPNVGNYSPTEIVAAKSGTEIIEAIEAPQFDFTKQVVLSAAIDERLVPAHDMRLSLIRGGLHLSASSDGSSLVVLPQQFSHCLRARDTRVRLVRANLLLTGVLFSGNIDTDILSDYRIFSPGCRRADLADVRRLIEPRRAMGEPMLLPPEYPKEPESSGPIITEETALAELPQPPTVGFKFIGMQGLNAAVEGTDSVIAGQPILRLVAIPTAGRHYFATQSTALNKDQVYRVTTWVKADGGLLVEMQVSDELSPRGPTPANYGTVLFDPTVRRVLSVSGPLKGRGARQGPGGWQELWDDLTTSGGELILALGLFHSKEGSSFKGDGRLGLRLGGIGLTER
jgi:hypothetical protein